MKAIRFFLQEQNQRITYFSNKAEKRQAMLRPFDSAQDRQAQHERKFLNDYKPLSVRPEPVEGLFKGFSVSC